MSSPEALLAAGDFTALWNKALPLVKWQLGRMVQSGQLQSHYLTDDLIQQCSLAVGKALRKWDPVRGAFSTFMVKCIYTAAMDHIRREASGIVGGRDAQGHAGPLDEATMASGNPAILERLLTKENASRIAAALAVLTLDEYDVLVQYYGLGYNSPRPLRSIAKSYNLSTDETYRLLMRAIASMRMMLSDNNGADSHEQDRSPGI